LDLGHPIESVIGDHVRIDGGARRVVADLDQVAVGVVEVGEVLGFGISLTGGVPYQFDGVGRYGPVGVVGEIDAGVVAFAEGIGA
jgi:hypothetical protein